MAEAGDAAAPPHARNTVRMAVHMAVRSTASDLASDEGRVKGHRGTAAPRHPHAETRPRRVRLARSCSAYATHLPARSGRGPATLGLPGPLPLGSATAAHATASLRSALSLPARPWRGPWLGRGAAALRSPTPRLIHEGYEATPASRQAGPTLGPTRHRDTGWHCKIKPIQFKDRRP